MITTQEIIVELEGALKDFGLYQYEDKGADAVMDVMGIVGKLLHVTPIEEVEILKGVADHEHGAILLHDIIHLTENYDDKNGTTRLDDLFSADEVFIGECYS